MIKNDLTPQQQEVRDQKLQAYASREGDKARASQLELARIQATTPRPAVDPWPALKSIAYAPCYGLAIVAVTMLALCRRPVPQVLVDFLNN